MKKILLISGIIIAVAACVFFSLKSKEKIAPEKIIAQTLAAQVDTFNTAKNKLMAAVQNGADEKQLQSLFMQTRLAYKKFEWAAEYFSPATSRFFNGPPVQEIEMATGQIFQPAGLQVMEGYLFPKYDLTKKQDLITQIKLLQPGCDKYKGYFTDIDIFDWQVFDATKLEVFRILSLGITGFDNPLTLKSSIESATALESLTPALTLYGDDDDKQHLSEQISGAVQYLKTHTDFNSFNRAAFITQYGNPISTSITDLENKLHLHIIRYNRLLNQDAKTMFDADAFNVNAYAPDPSAFMSDKKVALGRVLFSDPILSGTKTRSCQSCHQPEKAFTDGMVKNLTIDGSKTVRRNTPTLLNAALQPSQFYDLRSGTLEDQASAVIQNKDEMHGSMVVAASRLWDNKGYRQLFAAAFPKSNRTSIDTTEVSNALGSYVRSLVYLNSRFDEYMRGNRSAMNHEELKGFNIFMGKAKCATCHYMPLFNGTFPPRFIIIESEVIGVPQTTAQTAIDTDMGRYDVLNTPAFKHAFKISTVRNASRTAPYMHNGVFTTLEQVMDFYNKGGGQGAGLNVDNQTLAADKLNLTQKECDEVIAFIKSLDSKVKM